MQDNGFRRIQVLGLASALVGWSFVSPQIPTRSRLPPQAGLAGLLVLLTRAPLGLCPPRLWAGVRLGLAVGSGAATAVVSTTSIPAVMTAWQSPGLAGVSQLRIRE
jgi:uncharacterized protein